MELYQLIINIPISDMKNATGVGFSLEGVIMAVVSGVMSLLGVIVAGRIQQHIVS